MADLVADDLVDLRVRDQLVADGVVRASTSLEADESLLTGEAEPVDKRAGDRLLSGSFVVAGSGGYQATAVGANAYARKFAAQARRFAPVRSELVDGINRILRYVTWAIAPVAVLLVISQLHGHRTLREAAVRTVAALVGMVPQGLVLRYDQMSGLDPEQLDELVWLVEEQLEEPWHKTIGRPKDLSLREAIVVACGYMRQNILRRNGVCILKH